MIYIEKSRMRSLTEVKVETIFIYRPKVLGNSSIFENKVLAKHCIKMIGFLDAGRIANILRYTYEWLQLLNNTLSNYKTLIGKSEILNNILKLISHYILNFNPNLGENGSISNIGHVDLTKYEFRFNYEIVKDHFDLKESDTYITYFHKFFIYAEKCFTDILEIMKSIYDYVTVEGDYLPEDVSYIGEEVKEIERFFNTIIELKDFLSTVIEGAPDDLSLQKNRMKSTVTDNPVIQSVIERVLNY